MPVQTPNITNWGLLDFSQFSPEIEVIAKPKCTRHNRVPDELMPKVLAAISMEGELTISRSFEEHPTANFTFVTYRNLKEDILNAFRIGTIFTFFELDFVVENLAFKEPKDNEYPQQLIGVDCSLTGVWEKAITKKIALVDFVDSIDKLHPECLQKLPQISKKTKIKLSKLARKAEAKFSGDGSHWWIEVAPYIDPKTTVTVEEILTSLLSINGCFRFYSNPRQIEAKRLWQTELWKIPESDISSEINTQVKGDYYHSDRFDPENKNFYLCESVGIGTAKPVPPPEPPLREEDLPWPLGDIWWPPKKVTFPEEAEDTLPDKKDNRPSSQIPPVRVELPSGDENAEQPPENQGLIKDVALCYPNGPKKVKVITIMEDDIEIEKRTQTYGYVFYGRDCWQWVNTGEDGYKWENIAIAPQWRMVEETVMTKEYGDYDYYLGFKSQGWRLVRYRDESSGGSVPETAIIKALFESLTGDVDDLINEDHIGKLLVDINAKDVFDAIAAFVIFSKEAGLGSDYYQVQKVIDKIRSNLENWNIPVAAGNPPEDLASSVSEISTTLTEGIGSLQSAITAKETIITSLIRLFVEAIAPLYEFRVVPIFEQEARELNSMLDPYPGIEHPSKFGKAYIKCLPNGQATYAADRLDKDIAPMYYLKKKSHLKTEYSEIDNPEYGIQNWVNGVLQSSDLEKLPKEVSETLKVGEEMYNVLEYKAFDKTDRKIYPFVKKEFYKEYTFEWTGNASGTRSRSFDKTSQGKLPIAERRVKERDEPKEDNEPNKVDNETKYEFYASTNSFEKQNPNYFGLRPVGKTSLADDILFAEEIHYTQAKNIKEAKTGAETDYILSNVRSGPSESLSLVFDPKYLKIKEGDRFDYVINNEIRRRIVTGVSFSVSFQGIANQRPLVTSNGINLQLVPRRDLPLKWDKIKPKQVEPDIQNIELQQSFIDTIIKSDLQLWRSRLNPTYSPPD